MFRALRGMMRVMRHEAYVGLLLTSGTPDVSLVLIFALVLVVALVDSVHRGEYCDVLPFTLPRLRD